MILDCSVAPVEVAPIPDSPPVDPYEANMLRLNDLAEARPEGPEWYWREVARFSYHEDD